MESKLCQCGCGNPVKLPTSKYLSGHINRDPEVQKRKRKRMVDKYGVDHTSKLETTKEKIKQTCLDHFGSTTSLTNPEHIKKNKQIILDKLGVDNPFKSETIKRKIKQTNLKRLGVENPMFSEAVKEKGRKTSLERYGFESPNCSDEVIQKKKETCRKNYGVDSPAQSKVIQKRSEDSQILKFGDLYCRTEEARKSYRINFLNMIHNQRNNNEPVSPRIGNHERIYLNELQKCTKYHIIRNDQTIGYTYGYFPDGYIKELSLLIEFDEKYHEWPSQKEKDITRELELASYLSCILFRVKQNEWETDPEAIIKRFMLLLDLLEDSRN